MNVEWIERRVLALLTAGAQVSLAEAMEEFDRELAAPIQMVDPELAEQRRAMGIAV